MSQDFEAERLSNGNCWYWHPNGKNYQTLNLLQMAMAFLNVLRAPLYIIFFCCVFMESPLPSPQIPGISVTSFPKTGNTWLKALTFVIVTRSRYSPLCHMNVFLSWNMTLPKIQLIDTRQSHWYLLMFLTVSYQNLLFLLLAKLSCKGCVWFSMVLHSQADKMQKCWTSASGRRFIFICNGLANYGPYWDHVLGYWRASLESPEKTLFLTYEERKKDTTAYVKNLAEFMGCSFTLEEEEEGEVQKIMNV